MKKKRFTLEASIQKENWWVLTDHQFKVMICFENGRYEHTSEIAVMEDSCLNKMDAASASIIKEKVKEDMESYLSTRHYCAMYGKHPNSLFQYDDETDQMVLTLNLKGNFKLTFDKDRSVTQLYYALRRINWSMLNLRGDNSICGEGDKYLYKQTDMDRRQEVFGDQVIPNEFIADDSDAME